MAVLHIQNLCRSHVQTSSKDKPTVYEISDNHLSQMDSFCNVASQTIRAFHRRCSTGCMTVVAGVIWPIERGEGTLLGQAGSGIPVTWHAGRTGHGNGGIGSHASGVSLAG